jgi:hypothetical protein
VVGRALSRGELQGCAVRESAAPLGLGRPASHQIGREGAGGGFEAEIQEMGRRAAGVKEGDEKMK